MSPTYSYPGLPKVPASANLPKKPDPQNTPLDNTNEQASESSGASQNLRMNAPGDMPGQRLNTPQIPPNLPRLSSTTKDILARVHGGRNAPTTPEPLNGFFRDFRPISGFLTPYTASGSAAVALSSPSSDPVGGPKLSTTPSLDTDKRARDFSATGSDPHHEVLNHPAKASTSIPYNPTSQTLGNLQLRGWTESTIKEASTINPQGSVIPVPASTRNTPSSSRQQREYVLQDGTIVNSGKGLGRGRPGIKRGPRKPKLDPTSSTTSVRNTPALISGPGKKRKRSLLTEDEERIKTRISVSDDEDSDNYTPKATHTRSGRSTQKPSALVPIDTPDQKKPRLAAGPTDAQGKSLLIKKKVYRGREQNALCELCLRGRGPVDNAIVFCDGCNLCWHQKCHDPRIPKELVLDTKAEWFCKDCAVKLELTAPGAGDTTAQQSGESVPRAAPSTVEPAASTWTEPAPPSTTAGGAAVTTTSASLIGASSLAKEQRQQYLNSLSRQQLLGLLLHVSNVAPDLLIFPALAPQVATMITSNPTTDPNPTPAPVPDHTTAPQSHIMVGPSGSPSTTATNMSPPPLPPPPLATSPNPNLNPSRAAKAAAPKYTSPSSPSSESAEDSEQEEEYEEEEDYAPSHSKCYPKPGQGVMAMLPTDSADEHMLLEGLKSETFSHSLKGKGTGLFGMGKWLSEDNRGLKDEDKENWVHNGSRVRAR